MTRVDVTMDLRIFLYTTTPTNLFLPTSITSILVRVLEMQSRAKCAFRGVALGRTGFPITNCGRTRFMPTNCAGQKRRLCVRLISSTDIKANPSLFSYLMNRRTFHESLVRCAVSSFDPLQYPSSAALLKQKTTDGLSPDEIELRGCLQDYQERPRDLDLLDALQHAYSALEYWEEALAVEKEKCSMLTLNSPEYADSIHNQGKLWLRQGNFEFSKPLYEEALDYFQKSDNRPQEGHALISLAGWYFFQHEVTQDGDSLQTAIDCLTRAESLLDSNPALLVKCLDNQGLIIRLRGDYEGALDKYQQALQVVVDQKTRHALQFHVADMKVALQEPQEALILYQDLLHEVQENSSGDNDSESLAMQGVLWHNIATIHVQLGELDIAEEAFREALRLKESSAGRDNHPELAKTWNSLGALYFGVLDEKRQAIECFRNVLWITRSNSEFDDPRTDPDVLAAIQTISDIEEQFQKEKQGKH